MVESDDQSGPSSSAVRASAARRPSESREVAAKRWIDEHGDILWRFALSRTRSRDAAEEIVQETLVAAIEGHAGFAGASSERTWLLGIAAHKIADHFRRVRRAASAAAPVRGSDDTGRPGTNASDFTEGGTWSRIPARWPTTRHGSEERAEQLAALRACIDSLPAGQAEAVWLRDVLEVPTAEVCKAMGLTDTNLWTRLHRARAFLRSCLERTFGVRKGNRPSSDS